MAGKISLRSDSSRNSIFTRNFLFFQVPCSISGCSHFFWFMLHIVSEHYGHETYPQKNHFKPNHNISSLIISKRHLSAECEYGHSIINLYIVIQKNLKTKLN